MTEQLERNIIKLIATDRIDRPISSMSGKLKRAKPKLANGIDLNGYGKSFEGERVYAHIRTEDRMKARGLRDGVDAFKQAYPQHGKILEGMIAEERLSRETNLYFGVQDARRLTSDDYMGVMKDLGFSQATAKGLYSELIEVSYNLARSRNETQRSILIG
jgi:hypothetical protein